MNPFKPLRSLFRLTTLPTAAILAVTVVLLAGCSALTPDETLPDTVSVSDTTESGTNQSTPATTTDTPTPTTTAKTTATTAAPTSELIAETTAETSSETAAGTATERAIIVDGNLTLTYNPDGSLMSAIIDAPYHSQLHPDKVVSGCETASFLTCLQTKGYAMDYTLLDFVDLLPYADDPDEGFWGNIWSLDKPPSTIHAGPLAVFGQTFGEVEDLSGTDFAGILDEVEQGNPVMVWVTARWEPLRWVQTEIEGEKRWVVDNIHVMPIIGVDYERQQILVSDPWDSMNGVIAPEYAEYWVDFSVAEPIYEERQMALVVR